MVTVENRNSMNGFMFLLVLALCVDLFTPYLIWKHIIPAEIRWVSHFAIALMIVITVMRMLGFRKVPRAAWLILTISILWGYVAIGHGQGLLASVWGIWLFFQFPFVGLFVYLQPNIPEQLPALIYKYGIALLGLETFAQFLQYAAGTTPGDSLSGLFGESGTTKAVMFAILICCIGFGYWVAYRRGGELLVALVLGAVSSVLGEMKMFPFAIGALAFMAMTIYSIRHHAPVKAFIYSTWIGLIILGFVAFYNIVISGINHLPLQTFITNSEMVSEYFYRSDRNYASAQKYLNIRRADAVQIGWESLKQDPVIFLFGYGIGSRSESKSLGTVGLTLSAGGLIQDKGTGLLVMMQEMGVIGLVLFAGFLIWLLLALVHDIRAYPESLATGLRYGLCFFSVLWPLWLFYTTAWTMRVPMILYWLCLGYVLAESRLMREQLQTLRYETISIRR